MISSEINSCTPRTNGSGKSSAVPGVGPSQDSKRVGVMKKELYTELIKQDIPFALATHITSFFDDMASYAHIFTSELCRSRWMEIPSTFDWVPNEQIGEDKLIRDWRGRSVRDKSYDDYLIPRSVSRSTIGAPIIDSEEHTDGRTMVKSVHIPNCPHGEARKGTMFTNNDTSVSNFIGQCLVSILFDVMQSPPSD